MMEFEFRGTPGLCFHSWPCAGLLVHLLGGICPHSSLGVGTSASTVSALLRLNFRGLAGTQGFL